jgi:hypothetical protein
VTLVNQPIACAPSPEPPVNGVGSERLDDVLEGQELAGVHLVAYTDDAPAFPNTWVGMGAPLLTVAVGPRGPGYSKRTCASIAHTAANRPEYNHG